MDNLPTVAPEADPAALAFARLAEKVDLLEAAIAGLAAKREALPDYSETLGEIAGLLQKMREAINTLARRPAMTLTPDAMAEQIAAAGTKARAEDSATITQARDRIDKAASRMEHLAGAIATIREQRRRLQWAAGGGLLAGILLWSFLPGSIARAVPESWRWPERMAARLLNEPSVWRAGEQIMAVADAERWQELQMFQAIGRENREAIERCRRTVDRTKRDQRCVVTLSSEADGDERILSSNRNSR